MSQVITGYSATHEELVRKVVSYLKLGRRDVVYDVGCGDGRIAIEIWNKYKCNVIGIDIEPVFLQLAKANSKETAIKWLLQDVREVDYSDATVLFLTIKDNKEFEEQIYNEIQTGTLVVTFGWDLRVPEFKLAYSERVNLQGLVYDLSISLRNFEHISKVYPLTIKDLIEKFPSRLHYSWAGPMWSEFRVYEK